MEIPNNRLLNNAKWIVVCRVIQSLVQMVVGMLSARYLGPSNYGLINYAASVVAFFVPVMQLGLQSTLVQEYISAPKREGEIAGTSLAMNLVAAVICIIGVVIFTIVANCGELVTIIVCVLYSISLLFQAVEMLQYWFQARLLSKYSSIAMLCAYIVASAYRVCLLAIKSSVYWFALSHAVEYCVGGVLMLSAYRKHKTQRLSYKKSVVNDLIRKSRHYIVASMMVVVFSGTGNVMLKLFCGEMETGYYATAVTCNWVTGFVFTAIIDSARPIILESLQKNERDFKTGISRLYAVIICLSLAQSVFFTLFAEVVIKFLYGAAYLPAAPVLRILGWCTAFSYMGTVRNIWILGEEMHSVLWIINLCGAVASVILNALLIPRWGACGAALASVLTQVFTNFIMGFILKPIRENNRLLLKGLDPRLLVEMVRMLLNKQL